MLKGEEKIGFYKDVIIPIEFNFTGSLANLVGRLGCRYINFCLSNGNSIRLGGPAHGIVTKTLPRGGVVGV